MWKLNVVWVLSFFLMGCNSSSFKVKEYLASADYLDKDNFKYIVIIPGAGCAGCISYVEDFYTRYNKEKSIYYVFTNIVSQKILKNKVLINESNTFCDVENKVMDFYPADMKIYPCVLELNSGEVENVYYQSPSQDALHILKTKMKLQ